MQSRKSNVKPLVNVMKTLLGPNGCPWDKEQTLESLRPFVIEEAFEVVDAIDSGNPNAIKEELGDLLLQIVFQSELTKEKGWFGFEEVVEGICEKLIRRHPWVFGDEKAENSEQALENWEAIKAKEKKDRGVLDGVPVALPSLLRAVRVGEKAASVGFDWPDADGAREKISEELQELDEAVSAEDPKSIEHELGDLLFAIASFARKINVDPEASLRGTMNRFTERFRYMERETKLELSRLSFTEQDQLWEKAKIAEQKKQK